MPVPTDTFRSTRKLNLLFLASAVLLAVATVALVLADFAREWHKYQIASDRWETAMVEDAVVTFRRSEEARQVNELEQQIVELRDSLPTDRIEQLNKQLQEAIDEQETLKLPLAAAKGEIAPLEQQVERAKLAGDQDVVKAKQAELREVVGKFTKMNTRMTGIEGRIQEITARLNELKAEQDEVEKQITNLTRSRDANVEKLEVLEPTGLRWVAERVRNAPLLDWMNPSLKPQQDVVPEIRFDVNFMTVETIDRCRTCHVNIDKPAFELPTQLSFVERQVAMMEGQDVSDVDDPVVMLGFWLSAARDAMSAKQLNRINARTLEKVNELRDEVDLDEIAEDDADALTEELIRIASTEAGNEDQPRGTWYRQTSNYRAALQAGIENAIGATAYDKLVKVYRLTLIERYNDLRAEAGLKPVDPSPVLLAHPDLSLFVGVESAHPLKTMGCTVCHEGSGAETQFEHTAHTPRDTWVDARSGVPVPDMLVAETGSKVDMEAAVRRSRRPAHLTAQLKPVKAGAGLLTPLLAKADNPLPGDAHVDHGGEAHHILTAHHDANINDPHDPAPFAPKPPSHAEAAAYRDPGDDSGTLRLAVKQADHWKKKYGWHAIKYMYWEKPMHTLDYVESACVKCHNEVYDLKGSADKVYEGRVLFSQLGCVNCHAVTDLEDDLDIKQIGPNLQFVKDKLSAEMTGSWIWAPKAFRPMANMPHYFMLENNSQPIDILRTRVEVAAITHYLRNAEANIGYYEAMGESAPTYEPEPVPEGITGTAETGEELFKTIGCMSCHVNMNLTGEAWITRDLIARKDVDESEAAHEYEQMTYNQRHWYALEHLGDKLVRIGPELSGVGTKLLAGRTEAEATAWLYDWVRNPQHYSDYTIMPSFRLTEQEAMDVTAYLLTQQRPDDYAVVNFQQLDEQGKTMLSELVASLQEGQTTTLDMARELVGAMPQDEQLMFLGRKMISHYGCNGCHKINGFETAASACTTLDDWGLKDPHKLDFGYFDHAFDKRREKPVTITKVAHEGLEADATKITAESDKIQTVEGVEWEQMALTKRPWLYHKLHNTRLYDRMRTTLDGDLAADGLMDIGRPYDKLKMPKFFLTDAQVEALVTFVTSVRKPLVSETLRAQTYAGDRMALVKGRQLATLYNCYGCHNVEANDVQMHQYFGVYNADGSFNENALNWAPPRLIGQGSKTRPDWLHHFLQNVHGIRPWLQIRMPSFPLTNEDATALVDYFAASSNIISDDLASLLDPVEAYRANNPDAPWWRSMPTQAAELRAFADHADLMTSRQLDERFTPVDEVASNWDTVIGDIRVLTNTFATEYPFVETSNPVDAARLLRGEKLMVEMGCMAGECHRVGNNDLLAEKGMLVVTAAAGAAEDDYWDEEEDEEDGKAKPVIDVAPSTPPGGAPNLVLTEDRLQRDWVRNWLQHSHTIQPGTRMQEFWPGGESQFAMYPGDMRKEKESIYGYTMDAQRDLLLDWLYTVGGEKITLSPEGERLEGAPAPTIELTAIAPPPEAEKPAEGEGEGEQMAEGETETETQAEAPAEPTVVQTTSDIELHEGETEWAGSGNGRIVGVVNFEGKAPRRRPVRMDADRFCVSAHDSRPLDETLIVNDDNTIRNVAIIAQNAGGDVPSNMVVMDQIGCEYIPHIAVSMVGQTVEIRNSDNTLHNVKTKYFNKGMPVPGMKFTHTFDKEETLQFKCDVHPWMGAQLHVVETPYFDVSDVEGRFEIKGLPPGKYTFETRHEDSKVKEVTFEVEVKADTSTRVDVTVSR